MSTRNLMLFLAVVYLVASAGLAIGCQSSPRVGVDAEVYPQRRVAMQRPIVRFVPTPPSARAQNNQGSGASMDAGDVATGVPWYAYRNDIRDSVTAGFRSPVLTRTYTRTYDRTSIYDGEARNHYYQRRRTEQVVETVR
jgi:hypothetical protein